MRATRRALGAAALAAVGAAGCFGGSVGQIATVNETTDASNSMNSPTDAGGHPVRIFGSISPASDIDWWRISEGVGVGDIKVTCNAAQGVLTSVEVYNNILGLLGTVLCDGTTYTVSVPVSTPALHLLVDDNSVTGGTYDVTVTDPLF